MLEQKPRPSDAEANEKSTQRPSKKRAASTEHAKQPESTLYNPTELEQVQSERERWEETTVAKSTAHVPEQYPDATTQSGMPIKRTLHT